MRLSFLLFLIVFLASFNVVHSATWTDTEFSFDVLELAIQQVDKNERDDDEDDEDEDEDADFCRFDDEDERDDDLEFDEDSCEEN